MMQYCSMSWLKRRLHFLRLVRRGPGMRWDQVSVVKHCVEVYCIGMLYCCDASNLYCFLARTKVVPWIIGIQSYLEYFA